MITEPTRFSRSLAVCVTALLLGCGSTQARNILWGGQPNDVLLTSSGTPLTTGFLFEIGAFELGFVPTAANMNQWLSKWRVFDRAVSGDGWNAPVQWVSSISNLKADGTSQMAPSGTSFTFAEGEQGYLWAFNTQNYGAGAEWALITNNGSDSSAANDWLFPNPADQSTGTSVTWQFPDASTAIVGGVNNVRSLSGGSYSSSPTTFSLQTAAVPEPGSAVLLLAGALWGVRRRRTRA